MSNIMLCHVIICNVMLLLVCSYQDTLWILLVYMIIYSYMIIYRYIHMNVMSYVLCIYIYIVVYTHVRACVCVCACVRALSLNVNT